MFWVPSISPSSVMIYDGDKFPLWRGHYFIGALSGQQLQRVAFNQPPPQTERRESLLAAARCTRARRAARAGRLPLSRGRTGPAVGPGSTNLTPNGSILRIEPAKIEKQQ